MITKKEKQVTLYYINNLLSRPGLRESTETELFEWVGPRAKELFGMNLAEPERWSRRYRNMDEAQKRKTARGKTLPCSVKAIRAAIAEAGLVNINARGYDKTFDMLADVLKITPEAGAVLRRMVYNEILPLLSNFDSNVMDISGDFDCRRWQMPRIFGLPPFVAEKLLSLDGQLAARGIIEREGRIANLSPSFRRLLERSYAHLTEAQIRRIVVGKVAKASLGRDNFEYIADDYDHIAALIGNALKERRAGVNILLYGIPGTGKTELSKSVAASAGAKLYMLSDDAANDREKRLADFALMQTLLEDDGDALVLFDEAEDVFSERRGRFSDADSKNSKLYFNRMLERNKTPVIWISNDISDMDPAYIRRFKYALEVKKPDLNAKEEIWRRICVKRGVRLPADKVAEYAKRYDVPPSLIDTAVDSAKLSGSDGAIERTIESLHLAAYGPLPAGRSDNGVVFAPDLLNADIDIARLADNLVRKGRLNFSLCLYGEPGTGKSEFARYLAERMGLKVIHKRASDIKDCWVGSTERNIASAFREARDAKAMLVFDEADSFLRDRRHATHNWEVAHVNEMLTWMESHKYPFVCTTNLMDDIDEASLRRFTFKVCCGYLKQAQVAAAFKHFFGVEAESSALNTLTHLTPGDFAVVRSKRDFMDVDDNAELVRMLELEQSAKGIKCGKMGFAR